MTYTITSAVYANEEHTAAVMETVVAKSVAVSAVDDPDLWAELHTQTTPAPFVLSEKEKKIGVDVEMRRRFGLLYNGNDVASELLVWQYLQMKMTDTGSLNATEQTEWDKQKARAANIVPIYQAAKALINTVPIPEDYIADIYWPAVPA